MGLIALLLALAQGLDEDAMHRVTVAQVWTTRWTHACVDGTVAYRTREADGDWHIRIEADGAFLVAEIIPQIKLTAPKKGARVHVCGITRLDKAHGWYELHPVLVIRELPRNTRKRR